MINAVGAEVSGVSANDVDVDAVGQCAPIKVYHKVSAQVEQITTRLTVRWNSRTVNCPVSRFFTGNPSRNRIVTPPIEARRSHTHSLFPLLLIGLHLQPLNSVGEPLFLLNHLLDFDMVQI